MAKKTVSVQTLFKLEQVVVTATKTEKNITKVPASVSVITKEDLLKKEGVSYLLISHDLDLVKCFCQRVLKTDNFS